jgi:tol-pal system protein YbgF
MTLFCRTSLSLVASFLGLAVASSSLRADGGNASGGTTGLPRAPLAGTQETISIAQGYGRPPGEIGPGGDVYTPGDVPEGGPQDSASLLIRLGRLESQMRQINGQIEQMQFETHKLEEQLKKFQEDVEFRFRDAPARAPSASPPQRRGDAVPPQPKSDVLAGVQAQYTPASRPPGRGDAFDPSQAPGAPGAPRPLGSPVAAHPAHEPVAAAQASSTPGDPGAPLDLTNGRSKAAEVAAGTAHPSAAPGGSDAQGPVAARGTVMSGLANTPKGEFDLAMAYLKQGAYENAEKAFTGFLEKNGKDKLAPEAIFYLGESYYLRGRRREAAEQYLKISTQFANSPRAPQALLRLGQSLSALGAKEQACATFSEIPRKYPNAPAMVKAGADREAKRAQC